jgi:hypothetical protein
VSRLPCVSCDVDIPAEASNCPHCGQRQLTRTTAIGYLAVGLPVVFLSLGGFLLLGVPSVVDATVGVVGLAGALLGLYCLTGLAFLRAYLKRQRRLQQTPSPAADESVQ